MPTAEALETMGYDVAARLRSAVVPLHRMLRQQTAGLTATQGSVLGSISRHGPLRLSELADLERLSGPMISKVVTALEEEGLVDRVKDPADGRACLVRMSVAGGRWLVETRDRRDRWLAERLGHLTDEEFAAIVAALPALGRLAGDGA
jgi:DNA-binding MarR family transcriptional regulator